MVSAVSASWNSRNPRPTLREAQGLGSTVTWSGWPDGPLGVSFSMTTLSAPLQAPAKMSAPWLAGSSYSSGMGPCICQPPRSHDPINRLGLHLQVTPSAQHLLLFPKWLGQPAPPETSGRAPGTTGGVPLPAVGCQGCRCSNPGETGLRDNGRKLVH